jgi:hypothetical protein
MLLFLLAFSPRQQDHKVDKGEYLVSKCQDYKGNRALDVLLKDAQLAAFKAFMRCAKHLSTHDLVEEFLAAGVWPLSEGWTGLREVGLWEVGLWEAGLVNPREGFVGTKRWREGALMALEVEPLAEGPEIKAPEGPG